MSSLIPKDFCRDFQNREVKLLSLSEMMDISTPHVVVQFLLMYVLVSFYISSVSFIGRKCVDLVNLSKITQMMLSPPVVLGSLVMKSMVIRSHFPLGYFRFLDKTRGLLVFHLNLGTIQELAHIGSDFCLHVWPPIKFLEVQIHLV